VTADGEAQPTRTLAERVDYLFRSVRKPNRREYSNDEVSAAIARDQGVSLSASYLWYLRTGQRDNPTFKHLNALARFFGVPPAYFFDDDTSAQVEAELALLTAVHDAGVRDVALRASGLSAKSLDAITDMINRVRELEGLSPFRERQPGADTAE
jgi:transcriptional regulator with XRE-family HTH domain